MNNFSLRWAILHRLLSGLIGKSMFIISLSLPLSKLVVLGIDLSRYIFALSGAVFISICYILEKVFILNIIEEYSNAFQYAHHILAKDKMQVLDFFMEFEFLNDYKNANISSEINDDIGKMKKFLPIEEGKKILGNDKAIFMFAELKYIIADKSKLTIRCILTLLFYTGIILLYLPVTEAIYNILIHHR